MLHDERFSSKAKVDRYGRRLKHTNSHNDGRKKGGLHGLQGLQRLYRVEDSEQDEEESDEDEEIQAELARISRSEGKKPYDPARDGGFSESSSSQEDSDDDDDDESSSDDDEDGLDVDDESETSYPTGQAASSETPVGEITKRMAVVNLDWDNIRAVDLLAVFSSFLKGAQSLHGHIEKVVIYPSEFGRERMQREEREGPPRELFSSRATEESSDDTEDEEGSDDDEDEDERIRKSLVKEDKGEEFSSTHLRRYQLERLRYYYAVLTCSTSGVANHIYQNVDGTEYLSSANFFDLRFVPDEMDFSDEIPRDECDSVPDNYRPNEFVTDALQHSKVKLTWDADDTKRKEAQKRAFGGSRKDINENDLQAYLGTDSSSDENEDADDDVEVIDATNATTIATEEQRLIPDPKPKATLSKKEAERQRMRSLLGLSAEPAPHRSKQKTEQVPVGDMQITFTSGLSDSKTGNRGSVFENEPLPTGETTVEKYIRKEKERKAKRRDKAKAMREGRDGEVDGEEEIAIGDQEGEKEDLGFDDPFFTANSTDAKAASKKKSKVEERHKRAKAEEGDEVTAAAEIEQLEALMATDGNGGNDLGDSVTTVQEMRHFSMPLLEKAEKALKKQQKSKGKKKLSAAEKAALEAKAKDEFEMDVSDPRFTAVFERSEYALDPTHPGFKGTEGMRKLLDEGRERRKRRRGQEEDGDEEAEVGITSVGVVSGHKKR